MRRTTVVLMLAGCIHARPIINMLDSNPQFGGVMDYDIDDADLAGREATVHCGGTFTQGDVKIVDRRMVVTFRCDTEAGRPAVDVAPYPAPPASPPAHAREYEPENPEEHAVEEFSRPVGDAPGEVRVLDTPNDALMKWRKERAFTRLTAGCDPMHSKLISATRPGDGYVHLQYRCEPRLEPARAAEGVLPLTVQQRPELGDLSPENAHRVGTSWWEMVLAYRNTSGAPRDARVECRIEGGGRILNLETHHERAVPPGELALIKVSIQDAGAPAEQAVCRLLPP